MARSDVDLLIGTTRDEMRMFLDPRAAEFDRERLTRRAARYLESLGGPVDAAPSLVASYDGDPHVPTSGDVWSAIQTDGEMRRPFDAMAGAHAGNARRTFTYRFDEPLAGRLAHLGACHAADLPYPFGTVDRSGWDEVLGPEAPALAGAVQSAWVAFARDGDPSCDDLGPWPAHDTDRRATMLLAGGGGQLVDDPDSDRRRLWAELAPVHSDRQP
jgi:para-nitrobenzyl esterase